MISLTSVGASNFGRVGLPSQQIRFCTSADGTRIAYASCGTGAPLIWAAHWVGHLQLSWDNQVWRPWLAMLMHRHALIRYDARGCGLSDRDVADLSLDRHIEDLEAVVAAAGLERFALFGWPGAGPLPSIMRHATRNM